MSLCHILLTRFNVRRDSLADARAISIDWLRHRLSLFTAVTVPSILSQSRLPDHWLLFLDEQTPQEFRSELAVALSEVPWVRVVYCGQLDLTVLTAAVSSCLSPQTDWLLTTRVDNDDALNPALIDNVRSSARIGLREFINPRNGVIFASGRLYRKRDYSSPFMTLSESARDFKTVWLDQHQRLSRHGTVRQLDLKDAWIQLVHGGNIANQVRGVRVRGQSIAAGVLPQSLAGQVLTVSYIDWSFDNTVGLVRRYFGSAWRRLLREISDRGSR